MKRQTISRVSDPLTLVAATLGQELLSPPLAVGLGLVLRATRLPGYSPARARVRHCCTSTRAADFADDAAGKKTPPRRLGMVFITRVRGRSPQPGSPSP